MNANLIVFSRGRETARVDYASPNGGHVHEDVPVDAELMEAIEAEIDQRYPYSNKKNLLYNPGHGNFKHHDGTALRLFKNDELAHKIDHKLLTKLTFQYSKK